jgi:hypothetical protein
MKITSILIALILPFSALGQSWELNAPDLYFNSGKVGIGIQSPVDQLHVASNANHGIKLSRANGLYGFRLYRDAQGGWIHFQNTDDSNNPGTRILFAEGGTAWQNVLLNPNGGNVGIGTLTPNQKLEVVGIGRFTGNQSFSIGNDGNRDRIAAAYGSGAYFRFLTSANSYASIGAVGMVVGSSYADNYSPPANGLIVQGAVGIGTNTPSNTLDVMGGITIQSNNNINWGGAFGPGIPTITAAVNSGIYFYPTGTTSGIAVRIHPSGNVGIGVDTPDQKLTVDGTVRCEEVKVELIAGSGPDYVFESTYNLLPLSEVESYIKANKHLPEVPSAKQMEEEGLNLKEMNLLLLRKVEELTLHLIEQEKKIDELSKRSVSPDPSGKKVEELTLHLVEQGKTNSSHERKILELQIEIEKLKTK